MKKNKILISLSQVQFNKATVINPDDFEDVYYCLGFQYIAGNEIRFLIKHVLNPYEFSVKRGIAHVEPSPDFLCEMYNLAAKEQAKIVVNIHWHKFEDEPIFSPKDDKVAFYLEHDAKKRSPDIKVVQIIFGKDSKHFKARYLSENSFVYFDNIEIIGSNGIIILPRKENIDFSFENIFEKNVLAFSREGQEKIARTKIAVIGAGGVGSGLLYQMAKVGFQNVSIIDSDRITTNNCNRLYFVNKPSKAVRKFKAKFIAKAIRRFNPKARVNYFIGNAQDEKAQELLKEVDLIVLAVDNDAVRTLISSFCSQYCKPLVNVSSGIFMNKEGKKIENAGTQTQWFLPREAEYPCLRCQCSLSQHEIQQELMDDTQKENRRKAGYIANTQTNPEPQVMPLNSIGISLTMWQICCWLIGIRKPEPWAYYDAIQNKIINMQVKQNSQCSCCGLNELTILAAGDYKNCVEGLEK